MTDQPQVSTKDKPGLYDAIETAKPGEPLFPIQGGDPFGPPTVLYWAGLCRQAGMEEQDPKKADALLRKASDAERIGWLMQDYQRGVVANAQPGEQPTAKVNPLYSGWVDHADEETVQRRKERAGRIDATGRVHNAIAVATEAADGLAALRCCPTEEALLREAIEQMRSAALEIEPRRGNERS